MTRSLDEWYKLINGIYMDRNFYRTLESVFCHFIEVSRGLSVAATKGRKRDLVPEEFLPKSLAWWFAVCGRAGVPSVERMIWAKFPAVCPYCRLPRHDGSKCKERDKTKSTVDWVQLRMIGEANERKRPKTLAGWQMMFQEIYVRDDQTDHELNVKRLAEEIGETSEAIRAISLAPKYFISEAPDIFAWLMGFANQFDSERGVDPHQFGAFLENRMEEEYPDGCRACGWAVCKCPPILSSTLGRIAKEAPVQDIFPDYPNLFSLEESIKQFSRAEAAFKVGDQEVKPSRDEFQKISQDITAILNGVDQLSNLQPKVLASLAAQLGQLEAVARQGVVSNSSVQAIVSQLESLPSEQRTQVLGYFNNIAASATFLAIIKFVSSAFGVHF